MLQTPHDVFTLGRPGGGGRKGAAPVPLVDCVDYNDITNVTLASRSCSGLAIHPLMFADRCSTGVAATVWDRNIPPHYKQLVLVSQRQRT